MARYLIAGCGYVGKALAARLASVGGHEVFALRRSIGALAGLEGVTPIAADLTDPATLRNLPPNIDGVVYMASPPTPDTAGYRAAYVDGVSNLFAALKRQRDRIGRVVLTSSTRVYGQSTDAWVDEATQPEPTRGTARVLLEGERAAVASGWPVVVLRLGGIYGPGRSERMIARVLAGDFRFNPAVPAWTNRIHQDDAAGAIDHLLHLPAPRPVYVGVDREPVTREALYRWVYERAGRSWPGQVGAVQGSAVSPIGPSKRLSSGLLIASGYKLRVPTFREGYGPVIDALSR